MTNVINKNTQLKIKNRTIRFTNLLKMNVSNDPKALTQQIVNAL